MTIYDFSRDVRGSGRRSRLLVDEDFSWSDPPSRRSQPETAERPEQARSGGAFPQPKVAPLDGSFYEDEQPGRRLRTGYDGRPARGPRSSYGDVAVRDLRRDPREDRGWDRAGEPEFEEIDAEDIYVDADSGELELSAQGRRTIVITGHGDHHGLPARRSREAGLRVYERTSFKPDRIALWAFLLALAVLLGATTSSHAATLVVHHLPH